MTLARPPRSFIALVAAFLFLLSFVNLSQQSPLPANTAKASPFAAQRPTRPQHNLRERTGAAQYNIDSDELSDSSSGSEYRPSSPSQVVSSAIAVTSEAATSSRHEERSRETSSRAHEDHETATSPPPRGLQRQMSNMEIAVPQREVSPLQTASPQEMASLQRSQSPSSSGYSMSSYPSSDSSPRSILQPPSVPWRWSRSHSAGSSPDNMYPGSPDEYMAQMDREADRFSSGTLSPARTASSPEHLPSLVIRPAGQMVRQRREQQIDRSFRPQRSPRRLEDLDEHQRRLLREIVHTSPSGSEDDGDIETTKPGRAKGIRHLDQLDDLPENRAKKSKSSQSDESWAASDSESSSSLSTLEEKASRKIDRLRSSGKEVMKDHGSSKKVDRKKANRFVVLSSSSDVSGRGPASNRAQDPNEASSSRRARRTSRKARDMSRTQGKQ
jgi:hypothetical protein